MMPYFQSIYQIHITELLNDCNSDQTICDEDDGWDSSMGNGFGMIMSRTF